MTELNAAVRDIPLPESMRSLPVDARGFPVPWFVDWIDGEPDFRVIDRRKLEAAVRDGSRCWICGGKLGRLKVSVVGPMCTVNRVSSEPSSHLPCARYAARACPFLANPRMRRNEVGMPEEKFMSGLGVLRNPGVTVLWMSRQTSRPFAIASGDGKAGVLFKLGGPEHVEWWTQGRLATQAECRDALEAGLPSLRALAEAEGNGAIEDLARATLGAVALFPAEEKDWHDNDQDSGAGARLDSSTG